MARLNCAPLKLGICLAQGVTNIGKLNSDVIKRWINGQDLTQGTEPYWIIDFGIGTSEHEAALYRAVYVC